MRIRSANARTKIATFAFVALITILTGIIVLFLLMQKVAIWSDNNQVIVQSPITLSFHKPVDVKKREMAVPVVEYVVADGAVLEFETDIEKYICEKFKDECLIAIAVAKAESGINANAWNSNDNGTLDTGIFQINSVHWNKEGCAFKDLVDPIKNVDCAYALKVSGGWGQWVTYLNDDHLAHINN